MVVSEKTWGIEELSVDDLFHCYKVAQLSLELARKTNISDETLLDNIYTAAIFHDIGKSVISKNILNKPGKLNRFEQRIIRDHPEMGVHICSKLQLNKDILSYIKHHHENYDGSGYPQGLKGKEIPLGARIIKICDVFDALCSDRPYRKGFEGNKVFEIMESEKETFDPGLYYIFKKMICG